MKSVLKFTKTFEDLFIRINPFSKQKTVYKFAFIIHPRSRRDIERKFPFFKHLPDTFADLFTKYYWPITLSKIEGLKSVKNGVGIEGYVISILPTASQMVEDRELALHRITQACILAKKRGAKIIGLGGLTSSFSKGGLDLLDRIGTSLTTGHAYTGYNITQNITALCDYMQLDKTQILIGVVGAAGSIGSISIKLLLRRGFKNFIFVDLERKRKQCNELLGEILISNQGVEASFSHQIKDIKKCDIIIAATNAPEALIQSSDLKWGAIVVDDAQPSDVHENVFLRNDVLVVEAGVTHTPGIKNNFNFGLKNREDNFCCLAELMILAANGWDRHYVINRASVDLVDKIIKMGRQLNFKIAKFQNFKEEISEEKLSFVKKCIQEKKYEYTS